MRATNTILFSFMHLITTKAHVEFLAKLDQQFPRKSGTDKQKTDVQYHNIDLHTFFHYGTLKKTFVKYVPVKDNGF